MTALPCPVLAACESCGTPAGLAVFEADTPVGVLCLTLCGPCENDHRVPRFAAVQATYRVLDHCEHTGRSVDEPTDSRGGAQ